MASKPPNERNLAAEHGVSVGTAGRATRLLRERGLVVTLPSRGTYVTKNHRTIQQEDVPRSEEPAVIEPLDNPCTIQC